MPFRKKKEKNKKSDDEKGKSKNNFKDSPPISSKPSEAEVPEGELVTQTEVEIQKEPVELESPAPSVEDIPISKEDATAEINSLLLSIVSGFSDYFIDVAEEIFEKRPKNIHFDSIRSDRKIGTTGIQLVSVNFSCDFGKAKAGLAVKVYKKSNELEPVIEKINYLNEKLKGFYALGVSTPKIIFSRNPILVMEGISGESFRHSSVPISEKYRLAGKCLSALHGHQPNKTNVTHYRELEIVTIESLPLNDDAKSYLRNSFSKFPIEKYATNAGAISFGDFHAGNLLYEINLYKSPLLMAHLIDPEFLQTETSTSDRFEDIANFFVHRAIQEYQLKQSLFQITREIRSFLSGYNEVLAYKLFSMKKYYNGEFTFNYHLALGVVLSILNLISMPDVTQEYISSQMEPRLKLAVLLLESPSIITDKGKLTELQVAT